jgi:hypothetical protein
MEGTKQMTDNELIKQVAEIDGRKVKFENGLWREFLSFDGRWSTDINPVDSYLFSYDAIIPVIQKQPIEIKSDISVLLGVKHDWCAWVDKTPRQLCEALAKAHKEQNK